MTQTMRRAFACVLLALSLACAGMMMPLSCDAYAEDEEVTVVTEDNGYTRVVGATDESNANLTKLQQQIESSAAEYDEALAKQAELQTKIDENQTKIDDLDVKIPVQQERSGDAMKSLYVLQQEGFGLVGFVLDSENLGDFLQRIEYLDCIQQHNVGELQKLADMKAEYESVQAGLAEDKMQVDEETDRAARALEQAKTAREEAQQRAIAEAQAAVEAAKAQAAELAAQQAAAAEAAVQSGDQGTIISYDGYTDAVGEEDVNWDQDKEAFVNEWAARIDAYLAGSPLSGQGTTFAVAAWTYGVDPRWSPAISNTESSKGLYCFASCNAWGWGSSSWGSWEEAIDSHVRGLARGYGYTITPAAAQKYCPPNASHWYSATLAQMESI